MTDMAILVLSCDKYSCTWDIFFDRWEQYATNLDTKIYLLSNIKDYARKNVETIKTGFDVDWSTNLIVALDQIQENNILLMIDDAPLNSEIDINRLELAYEQFLLLDLDYLNLKADPPMNGKKGDVVGMLMPGTLYRTALAPSIWKKIMLRRLLVKGESAWHFELFASRRSDVFEKFYSVNVPVFDILHYIIKGKIERNAARILEATGEIKKINFHVMSRYEALGYQVNCIRSQIFHNLVPARFKAKFRSFYYKIFHGDKII